MKHYLAKWFRLPGRRELELAYLNASVSLYDLERRERDIEQGMFRTF